MVNGSIGYRSDIDVLRAFAVLPVLAFHMNKELLPGGYLGVDVFFVISGYLITRLLLAEVEKGGIDLWGFWQRRILRIIPALLAMTFFTFLGGQFLLYAPDRQDLAFNSLAALLSFGNFSHWLGYGGYWGAEAASSPLLHTWSLAVEEQFYLLYPIFILFAIQVFKVRIEWTLLSLLCISLVTFIYGSEHHPAATFYLAPTRAWELAAGALIAVVPTHTWAKRVSRSLAGAGLLLIFTSYALAEPAQIGLWNIVAVVGASLVILTNTSEPFSSWGLTNRVFLTIGLISYSLYLWHYPFIILTEAFELREGVEVPRLILLVLILSVSWVSWRYLETPIRRSKLFVKPIVASVLILAGVAFCFTKIEQYENFTIYEPTEWAGSFYSVVPQRALTTEQVRGMVGVNRVEGDSTYLRSSELPYAESGVVLEYGGRKIDVLVLGDSHGLQWSPVIDLVMRDMGKTVSFMTADGTSPFFDISLEDSGSGGLFFNADELLSFRKSTLRIIQDESPELVIIGAVWRESYLEEGKDLIDEIVRSGAKILLIADQPWLDIGERNAPQYLSYLGVEPAGEGASSWLDRVNYDRYVESLGVIHKIQNRCPEACTVIDPGGLYLKQDGAGSRMLKVIQDNHVLFVDDDHLSVYGAMLAVEIIRGYVSSLISGSEYQ